MKSKLKHIVEGSLILFGLLFFRILPLDFASMVGGALLEFLGPFSKADKIARANLARELPELTQAQHDKIVGGMWNNIGRVIAEYPHLCRPIMKRRIAIEGREHIDNIILTGRACVVVSGHFANWEIAPLALWLAGMKSEVIYRQANNPIAAWVSRKIRENYTKGLHEKGREGAVQSIKALKAGNALTLLIDQRMNNGSPLLFFGHKAMTATGAARLAIKFQVPVLAGRVVRKKGAHFTLVVEPPINFLKTDNSAVASQSLNNILERWVREFPEQWFWVHRRWGKKA